MGKKETKEVGEQIDLIDVAPENAKEIIAAGRIYKKAQVARSRALKNEVEQKGKVIQLVRESKIPPQEGGVIKFTYEGVTISVTPRDELVRVQEEAEPKS